MLKGVLGQEPAVAGPGNSATGRRRLGAPPKLTGKKSLASLRRARQNPTESLPTRGAQHNGYPHDGQRGQAGDAEFFDFTFGGSKIGF